MIQQHEPFQGNALVIPINTTTSNALRINPLLGQLVGMLTTATTAAITLQASWDGGSTWFNVAAMTGSGANVYLPLVPATYRGVKHFRLVSAGNEAAARTWYPVFCIS